jgi:hypothetical protein
MKDLSEIPFDKYLKFVSCDITNMYSKVSVKELLTTIELMPSKISPSKELR